MNEAHSIALQRLPEYIGVIGWESELKGSSLKLKIRDIDVVY